ncbi:uncharacterized protein BJ171DRAFT_276367 [Polychytrium aggregatum]|uniref:uncharacterized protein n=1 Tax=Polychytrium aggregatum TaxID=110093 RepID=UPI0022FE7EED|nr:uncharacterized protein BJ171DRAFT_276367 [Polychytrium aggregatum]KAI9207487.1 hypothetical protein BJ171DRAFT_276367 [Polychytrium aggregatum]
MNSALEVQKMRRSQPIAFGKKSPVLTVHRNVGTHSAGGILACSCAGSPDSGGGIAIQAPSRTGGARQSYSVSPAHMDSSIIRSFEEQGVHVPRGGMIINHDEDDGEGDVDESEGRDRDGYSDDGEDEGGGDQDEDGHMHDDDDDDDDNDDGEGDDGEEGDDDDDDEGSSRATYLAEAMDADLNIHNYGSSKKRQTIPKSTEL